MVKPDQMQSQLPAESSASCRRRKSISSQRLAIPTESGSAMVKKVCSQLINERQNEINRQSQHSTQRHNELSCYTKSIADIEDTLKKNLGYVLSEPFQRILADAARMFDKAGQ